MAKIHKKQSKLSFLLQPLFRVLILFISFLILVGDSTRWILRIVFLFPVRILQFCISLIKRFIFFIVHFFEQRKIKRTSEKKEKQARNIKKHTHVPSMWFRFPNFFRTSKSKYVKVSPLKARMMYFFYGLVVSAVIFSALYINSFIKALPNPKLIGTINFPVSTQIYDRKGRLIYEIYDDQNRTPVQLKSLPKYVSEAAIAIEDKDFYHHQGVSVFSGVIRAMRDMITTHSLQGGSTITQQLVKSALLSPERTIDRKIKEIVLAVWTEKLYTKDQILEMYLNQVPYGGSTYGIEKASQTYFGKEAKDLTISEAAFLAGLPQAPTIYSPYTNPEAAMNRRTDVLQKMKEQNYITDSEYKKALSTSLAIKPYTNFIKAPHFVFYVKQLLEQEYGQYQVGQGGLRVYTTLDLDIQQNTEQIVKEEIDKVTGYHISNGAALVTRPGTGEILAMVGSRDYFASPSGAFNVTTALRQPGSSIKPLMYSLALERGYTAATTIEDTPTNFIISASETYHPVNYDGKFHGNVTLRTALANSFNVPAVKVLNTIGVKNFVQHAQNMGISTFTNPDNYGLSITLGGAEVHMTDMATAFGVFANQGKRVDLNPVLKISDFRGNTLYTRPDSEKKSVLSEDAAYIISSILSDNAARALEFGAHSALEVPGHTVAVKTGTTNDIKDNWTIGYTPQYLVSVWVGNNDNTPMNPYLVSGITGAAPIWNRIIQYVLNDYSVQNDANSKELNSFKEPLDIIKRSCSGRIEYFVPGTESKASCGPTPFVKSLLTPSPIVKENENKDTNKNKDFRKYAR